MLSLGRKPLRSGSPGKGRRASWLSQKPLPPGVVPRSIPVNPNPQDAGNLENTPDVRIQHQNCMWIPKLILVAKYLLGAQDNNPGSKVGGEASLFASESQFYK